LVGDHSVAVWGAIGAGASGVEVGRCAVDALSFAWIGPRKRKPSSSGNADDGFGMLPGVL
jgi:hypothetical protein